MSKLRKYTLYHNGKNDKWNLCDDKSNKTVKSFKSKEVATAGGVLKKVLGKDGGSVKIKKLDGKFQEERTYPKSKDPKESRG
ncbi:MAG: DUF2188 domain-containing protein [Ignavibacteria bacterium]|nr:DUF2188 domain-containing protein [Ignavibacteria bacterium]